MFLILHRESRSVSVCLVQGSKAKWFVRIAVNSAPKNYSTAATLVSGKEPKQIAAQMCCWYIVDLNTSTITCLYHFMPFKGTMTNNWIWGPSKAAKLTFGHSPVQARQGMCPWKRTSLCPGHLCVLDPLGFVHWGSSPHHLSILQRETVFFKRWPDVPYGQTHLQAHEPCKTDKTE